MLAFLERGDIPLHAAAVEIDGEAVLLAAPGRFGKTTLAAAFVRAGYRLLTEDLCCIRLGPIPAIIPGPAMIRLRRDVAAEISLPQAVELGRDDDRVHYALADNGRGDSAPVPLSAIVFLRPGDGVPHLDPVDPVDAIADLWALSFRVPTEQGAARCFDGTIDIAGRVPVWNLRRPLRYDALDAAIEVIAHRRDVHV